ncbi:hypothetical protein SPRG_06886 [Saprolegnia parasitica CBS 223.65]|uniref:RxLR effector protein n=1 Tax=Saprolegnia parasitica (strain CBS 223.65) TaxID=695850 RepID=A0A067CM52_SAPPC|nr:hypothetical protein SPRG_06886 [Saprolegnia parasitica CBS 223.65]KDO27616.1 hypothetical protein SPRG_06886 [Saprolegnia parasitica CBS 223.65]|eukprot:XP_012201738.1 hypothetical protein SPRG_06886 [Saprolegnia parasitica CBS 223.65]
MKTSTVLLLMALAASASATLRGASYMLIEENDAPVFLEQYEAYEATHKHPSKKPAASYSKPSTKPHGNSKPSTEHTQKEPYILVSEDMNYADIGRAVLDAMRDDAAAYPPPSQSYDQPPASKPSYQQPPPSYQQPPPKKKHSYQRPSSYKKPPPTYLKPSSPYLKVSASYNQPKSSSDVEPRPSHDGPNKAPKGKYVILVDDSTYDDVADDGDVFLDMVDAEADMDAHKKKKNKTKKTTKYNLMDVRFVALADVDGVTERDLASNTVMDDGDYLIALNQHAADDDDAVFLADDTPAVGVPNPGFKTEKKKTNFFGNDKTLLTDETLDDVIRDAESVFIADRKRVPQHYHFKKARVLGAVDDGGDDDTSGLNIMDRRPTHLLTPSSGSAFNKNSGVQTFFLRSVPEDDVNDDEVNGGGDDDDDTSYILTNPWEDTGN